MSSDTDWTNSYFNYFTEIEEHFRAARGTSLFLLSPLDWALIESWKNAGVPLEAVLRGIDEAFEKWRSKKSKRRMVNSVAYCAQAVAEAAGRMSSAGMRPAPNAAPFSREELAGYLQRIAASYRAQANLLTIAESLDALRNDSEKQMDDLQRLEAHLTSLEEKTVAILRTALPEGELVAIRLRMENELAPYRGKMTADQLSMLERRYLDTALLEQASLPRLSLFYLH